MKIGFCVVDVTPEIGIYLTGYGRPERLAEGVHSPLNASIIVLADGETTAAVIGLDWCFVDRALTRIIRKEIGGRTGIPEQNILLCCSHTHSAPHATYMRALGRTAVDPENKGADYVIRSAPAIADGVRRAMDGLRECVAGFAQTTTSACVSRRGMDDNGKVRGFIQDPDQICDRNMVVVRFLDAQTGGDLGIFVHAGGHNTAMGGNRLISSDWCGVMKARIRDRYQVPVVFVNGALGDVGPRTSRFVDSPWKGTGFSAGGGDGVKSVEEVGLRAAGDALRALDGIREFRRELPLAVRVSQLRLPQALPMSEREAEAVLKECGETRNNSAEAETRCRIAETVLEHWKLAPEPELVLEQTIIAFGPVALVPFPFEVFSIFTLRLRKFGPYQYNLLCSNTNGRGAYLPDRGSFAAGGYEPEILKTIRPYVISPDAGDLAVVQSLKALREMKNEHGAVHDDKIS